MNVKIVNSKCDADDLKGEEADLKGDTPNLNRATTDLNRQTASRFLLIYKKLMKILAVKQTLSLTRESVEIKVLAFVFATAPASTTGWRSFLS